MASNLATKSGNWSDTTVWSLGHVPVATEDVNLASYVVAWDVGAGVRIPATGTLNRLTASGAGQLTVDLAVVGSVALHATTIAPGTVITGMVRVTGAAPTRTLTITGNITGGAGNDRVGVENESTGTVSVVGNITGGTGARAFGHYGITGKLIVTGTITGGAGAEAMGILSLAGTTVTFASCRLVDGAGGVAYGGVTPVWTVDFTPTGPYSGVIKMLEDLVANSVAFQVWTGTASAAEAATRVRWFLNDDDPLVYPFAVVGLDFDSETESIATGEVFYSRPKPIVAFFDDYSVASKQNSIIAFCNTIGAIRLDMQALAGKSGYMIVRSFVEMDMDFPTDERCNAGDSAMKALFRVET
jgi:hypothetical protein